MNLIFSHPTGNANVRAALNGLQSAGLLSEFCTTIATFPNSLSNRFGSTNFFLNLTKRNYDENLKELTHTVPVREVCRLLSSKLGISLLGKHEGICSIDAVIQNLDRVVAARLDKSMSAVYAYEDGAAFSFGKAKELGISCLYDLPIGYWRTARELLANEKERWPAWQSTITAFKDSPKKLERKDKELQLADHIFVASSFTATTLQNYPGTLQPVSVIPYGFPPAYRERDYSLASNRPLEILFVGGLSQRKGIADLFAAVDNFGTDVQLTIVGRKPTEDCEALNTVLKKHIWIPSLPHQQILQLMRKHDVLVFPSLFEGFGLVIAEAMSQGTPVITTNRTAGPDIINHGKNGWIVEAGSTQALKGAIEYILQNPDEIAKAGNAAIQTANARPWAVYGKELSNAILMQKKSFNKF